MDNLEYFAEKIKEFLGKDIKNVEGAENLYDIGINALFSITPGAISLDEALKNGSKNLERTVENVVRLL